MTTTFPSSSRLANFRQKKNSNHEDQLNVQPQMKLILPSETEDKPAYEPSSANFNNTRTSLRLLKGRIEKSGASEVQPLQPLQQKATNEEKPQGLKLVLNDSPQIVQKKRIEPEPQQKPPQKRIMIQKTLSMDEPKQQQISSKTSLNQKKIQKKVEQKQYVPPPQQYINPHDEKPIIKEEDVEQSKEQPENENDLVICPEGCGRKFNRRALEKHAKACKIVFMSKRKQFNSEAKRITSQEQATIVKQNKQKQKNQFGKTKGFEKTSDNWKAASEDFRAAIKAVKKEEDQNENEGQEEGNGGVPDNNLQLVECEYCEKKFAQVLIQKHIEKCPKKKEKDNKKKTTKKK